MQYTHFSINFISNKALEFHPMQASHTMQSDGEWLYLAQKHHHQSWASVKTSLFNFYMHSSWMSTQWIFCFLSFSFFFFKFRTFEAQLLEVTKLLMIIHRGGGELLSLPVLDRARNWSVCDWERTESNNCYVLSISLRPDREQRTRRERRKRKEAWLLSSAPLQW